MSETPRIAWKRVAVEAPVIVISILLAFAIDAWWQERGEREAETVLLEGLRTDYLQIRSALKVVEDEHREASDACLYFMGRPAGSALPATPEVDRMVALVFLAARTFNPGSGAVASFHASAGAQLLRNRLIADKILAWPGLVEELQEEEANLQKGVAERWGPFVASRVSLGPYVAVGDLAKGVPSRVTAPAMREPLVVDRDFLNQVLDRYKWQQLALRDIRPVQASVEEILSLIEVELSR